MLAVSYWGAGLRLVDVSEPPQLADPLGISWPPETGRWLGCPTDDAGWYGPDGGGHANMDPDVWLNANDGNDNIHYAVPQDNLICSGISEYEQDLLMLHTVRIGGTTLTLLRNMDPTQTTQDSFGP